MAIVLLTQSPETPDTTSQYVSLGLLPGRTLTVEGIIDANGKFAYAIASSQVHRANCYSTIRDTLIKKVEADFFKTKQLRDISIGRVRAEAELKLQRIEQANLNRFAILIGGSSGQGMLQEGDLVFAYPVGYEDFKHELGILTSILVDPISTVE